MEMDHTYIAGIIGGIVGGLVATAGAWVSAYWAPRKLEEQRELREEKRLWGPRKELIKEMLDMQIGGKGRTFTTLKLVTGTSDDDLRRLLVELGARGFKREDGTEAWIYRKDRPLLNLQKTKQKDAATGA